MYVDSKIARIRELAIRIYELNGEPVSEAVLKGFLGSVTTGRIGTKGLSTGLKLARYLLEHGPTASSELRSVIGGNVSHMSSLSPYQRGLVEVVDHRPVTGEVFQKNMRVYGVVEGKEELLRRKYVPWMEELVPLVERGEKNAS